MSKEYDIAIIGAGPAGSTTAGLLAKQGYRVLVVEREKFPRYHIGESLVPGTRPVLEELGIFDEVARFGFTNKPGATLRWGRERDLWSIFFEEAGPFGHSFQVVRSEFDYLLLKNARRLGATVLEDTQVVDIIFEGERCVGFTYAKTGGGPTASVRANLVVDASGQSTLLARKQKLIEWDEQLKNIAIWAYYQGGLNLDGEKTGNILIENILEGWIWVIPLHDGTQSVGWVTPVSNVKGRENLEQSYQRIIDGSLDTKRLLASATRVSDFRTARDWSYRSRQFYGPGFLLVGDAAAFVDPLFSTGVFLAMSGGSLAARIIGDVLKQPEREQELFRHYDETYKEFLGSVLSFVYYFYDASKAKEQYWERADELVDPIEEMSARQDFISLVSGLQGIRSLAGLDERLLAELEPVEDTRTPRDFFNMLDNRLAQEPQRTTGVTALYQFKITGEQGGEWYVNIIDGKVEIGEGEVASPGCTILMQDTDYVAMAVGRLKPLTALMTGKLKARGDRNLAMKMSTIFG
jgi:halogenation protein CepH